MRTKTLVAACSVVAAMVVAAHTTPAHAEAKRRVVIETVTGPTGLAKRAHRALTKAIAAKHEVVTVAPLARGATPADYAAVARESRVDAFVTGTISRRGKRATLRIAVRDGATGTVADTLRIPLRRGRIDRATRVAIGDDTLDLIAWVEPLPAPEPVAEPEPAPIRADQTLEVPEDAMAAEAQTRPTTRTRVDLVAPTGPRATVQAGASFAGRTLSFTHQASLTADQQPTSYEGGVVGGAYLRGEIYPARFAATAPALLHRIGATFELDTALGLSSRYQTDGMTHDFDTSQQRWGVGGRYHHALGAGELTARAGYNRLSHTIDNGAVTLDLPDVAYAYVDIGGGLAWPLSPALTFAADAKYLHVLDAGEIVQASAYGSATVRGIDADAHLAYAATERVFVTAGVRMVRMAFDFHGDGTMATDADADPDQDVGGAADQYVGGYLLGGVSF